MIKPLWVEAVLRLNIKARLVTDGGGVNPLRPLPALRSRTHTSDVLISYSVAPLTLFVLAGQPTPDQLVGSGASRFGAIQVKCHTACSNLIRRTETDQIKT